jgi:translation elongation factor EF-Tu-like GTPase
MGKRSPRGLTIESSSICPADHCRLPARRDQRLVGNPPSAFLGVEADFQFRTVKVRGSIVPAGKPRLWPGEMVTFTLLLTRPTPLEERLRFTMLVMGNLIGAGLVTDIET